MSRCTQARAPTRWKITSGFPEQSDMGIPPVTALGEGSVHTLSNGSVPEFARYHDGIVLTSPRPETIIPVGQDFDPDAILLAAQNELHAKAPMVSTNVALVTGSGKRRVGWHVADALA